MPTKAAYKTFETNPEVEFEFYLAQKLGLTVGRLRAEMSNDEFASWGVYYARLAQEQELAQLQAGGGRA